MQKPKFQLMISHKVPMFLIGAALLTAAAVGTTSFMKGSEITHQVASSKLISLKSARASEVKHYLASIEQDIRFVASNPTTLTAVNEFSSAWDVFPGNHTASLQKLYITDNPNPTGEKEKLDFAADGSTYSRVHREFYPWFRQFLNERGYYDIFLFDLDGNLVYTVFKKLDYATNLMTGEWKDTDLGNAFRAGLEASEAGKISFFDFKPYAPSFDAPASFMSTPIISPAGEKLGVLVFQMPIDRINGVMAVAEGLGETGETVLVGGDGLLRSDSHFHEGDSILKVSLDNKAVKEALQGNIGITEAINEEGHQALMAFAPIDFHGTRWSLIAQQVTAEIFEPIVQLRNGILAWSVGILLVMAAIGFIAGRSISRPISGLSAVMHKIAEGNTETEVAGLNRQDEIGDMAKSVEFFREKLVENAALEEQQKQAELQSQREKRESMLRLADELDSSVGTVIAALGSSASQMKSSATSMTSISDDASKRSSTVAAAAEQATANVQTVATATEELSASVAEISRQVAQSAQMAQDAVSNATETNAKIEGLADAAEKIGEVVNLINDIAAQTNLLALNATIEASRAGEAGTGFAVVASEVKSLASQTAKATEDIGAQIAAIQAETRDAVTAIQEIGKVISDISDTATTIASAVEEQGAATREIASNVQQAASGTQDVSSNIIEVSRGAQETGSASQQVLSAAEQLSGQSEELKTAVSSFLERVKAA